MFFKLLLILFIFSSTLFASENVTIGILAFRSKAETIKEWQSTADYLHQKEPNYNFVIVPLDYPEINEAVQNNKLDFVITNSGHYVYLEKKYHISRIATMERYKKGQWHDRFGGVVFTRAERLDINTFEDLKGKKIAAVDGDSLGGYATQMYELFRNGIDKKNLNMYVTGMPHKKVVQEVIEGRADVGFVRTDVLEDLSQNGSLDLKQLKILHPQKSETFPYFLSTALYPPYDKPEIFTIGDIWNKYKIAILFSTSMTFLFLFLFSWMYRKNSFEKAYAKSILDASPNPTVVTNGEFLISANKAMLSYLGYATLEKFRSEHNCICDLFEKGDTNEYLQPKMDDVFWIEYILSNSQKEHKAKITINGETTIFRIDASFVGNKKEFRAIAILTNISIMLTQSTTDTLTHIANRLHFDVLFEHAVHISQRDKSPLSVVFFDIDHFKKVNDIYGHLAGDEVLKRVANIAKNSLRKSDVIARWGGEEFIILLPDTPVKSAVEVAENLRLSIAHENFDVIGHLTCSFGVSYLYEDETEDTLLNRVDELLYNAKENGRNRVVVG